MGHRPELRPHDAGAPRGRCRLGRRCRRRVSVNLTELTPQTEYHFRLVASNAVGTTYGEDRHFTSVSAVPNVKTEAATRHHPHSRPAQRLLRRQRRRHPLLLRMGNRPELRPHDDGAPRGRRRLGVGPTPVSANLTELTPQTEYHFRLVAVNAVGTTFGDDHSFITLPAVPGVKTEPATNVMPRSAQLNGSFVGNGEDTHYYFEWGTDPSYGHTTRGAPRGGRRLGSRADTGRIRPDWPRSDHHLSFPARCVQCRRHHLRAECRASRRLQRRRFSRESVTRCALRKRDGPRSDQPRRRRHQISLRIRNRARIRSERDLRTQRADSRRRCWRRHDDRRGRRASRRTSRRGPSTTGESSPAMSPGRPSALIAAFTTFPFVPVLEDSCSNAHVRQQTGAAQLLDCRAYELVSAANTAGYDVESDLVPNQTPYPGYPDAETPSRVLYAVHDGGIPGTNHPTNRGPTPMSPPAMRKPAGRPNTSASPPTTPSRPHPSPRFPPAPAPTSKPSPSAAPKAARPASKAATPGSRFASPTAASSREWSRPRASNPGPAANPDGHIAKDLSANGEHFIFGSTSLFAEGGNNGTGDVSIYDHNLKTGETHVVSNTARTEDFPVPLPCLQGAGSCHSPRRLATGSPSSTSQATAPTSCSARRSQPTPTATSTGTSTWTSTTGSPRSTSPPAPPTASTMTG